MFSTTTLDLTATNPDAVRLREDTFLWVEEFCVLQATGIGFDEALLTLINFAISLRAAVYGFGNTADQLLAMSCAPTLPVYVPDEPIVRQDAKAGSLPPHSALLVERLINVFNEISSLIGFDRAFRGMFLLAFSLKVSDVGADCARDMLAHLASGYRQHADAEAAAAKTLH